MGKFFSILLNIKNFAKRQCEDGPDDISGGVCSNSSSYSSRVYVVVIAGLSEGLKIWRGGGHVVRW